MVLRNTVFLCSFMLFFSCGQKEENKGESIPAIPVLQSPLDYTKQILYLNTLIQENEQPQLLFYRARAYFHTHQYHLAKLDLDQLFNRTNEINDEYVLLYAWVNSRIGNVDKAYELLKLSNFSKHKTYESLPVFFEIYNQKKLKSDSLPVGTHFTMPKPSDYTNDFLVKNYLKYGLNTAPILQYQKVCLDLLKLYPFDAYYLSYWANFLFKMNKYDQAEKVFQKAIQLLPEQQSFKFDLAKFYFQLKNYPKAVTYFSAISKENNFYPEAQYHKAVSMVFLGKKEFGQQLMDSLSEQNSWRIKFYRNYLFKKDSTSNSIDSLVNLNQ